MWSNIFERDRRWEALFRAFDCIDGSCGCCGDNDDGRTKGDALERWISEHAGHVNDEILVVERVADSHRGKRLLDLGSPLYNAAVRDAPEAVAILLRGGADPNYAHPTHGDTPLLHCAERGHVECLRALLADGRIEAIDVDSHRTIYKKFLLGQALPHYEEGGLSPLAVAARGGRVDSVRVLLELCPPSWTRQWLAERDAAGRTVEQNALDSAALATEGSGKRERFEAIALVSAQQTGREAAEGEENAGSSKVTRTPRREEAMDRLKERLRIVRRRCADAEERRKEAERTRGLRAIEEHYKPLHPEVYSATEVSRACRSVNATSANGQVQEPIAGVFTFPLVDPEFCRSLWNELHHYETVATSDPKLRLPLRVRHDGNVGDLQDCGFRPTLDALASACTPVLRRCLRVSPPDPSSSSDPGDDVEVYHAFLTRNYTGRESNATFKMHRDKSDLTINVCLHASDDFEGSTVGFYRRGSDASGETSGDGDDEAAPEDDDRVFTHVHEVGHAVVHSGRAWHRTDPITEGTRGSLIVWLRTRMDAN